MDVDVYGAFANGSQYFGELSRSDSLCCRASDNVGCRDSSADATRRSPGAELRPYRTITQVRAIEDHNASIYTLLGDVNVSLSYVSRKTRISQLVVKSGVIGIDLHTKGASARGRESGDFFKSDQSGLEFIARALAIALGLRYGRQKAY